ncbi:hypothetical protein ACF0H5_020442 [Mactra antiquata]
MKNGIDLPCGTISCDSINITFPCEKRMNAVEAESSKEVLNLSNTELSTNQSNSGTYIAQPHDPKYISKLIAWEDNVVASFLLIVYVLALSLNTIVIYTCIKNWKSLLTSDYYILNLAISDIILPMAAFPLPISSSYFHKWMFGDIGCVAYGFLGFFFGLVSITTLTMMGVTRYISVCHPHISLSSVIFTRYSIIFPYIYAITWACIPLGGWGSYVVESYGTSCTLQWNDNKVFITLMSLFCISTPSVIMFCSYTLILYKCRKSNRNVRTWQGQQSKMPRSEAYLIKITFAMCWGFLISWMPYAVVSMWTAYGDVTKLPIRMTVIAVLLAKTSTVVNPVIYFLLNNKFRPMMIRSLNLHFFKNCRTRNLQSNTSAQTMALESQSIGSNSLCCNRSSRSDSTSSACKLLVRTSIEVDDIITPHDVQL